MAWNSALRKPTIADQNTPRKNTAEAHRLGFFMTEPLLKQSFADYLAARSHRQRVEDALAALTTYKKHKLIPVMGDRERTIAAKFPGWGTLGRLFTESSAAQWEQQARVELKQLLTDDEYAACRSTILNAFPTSPHVIAAMWEFLRQIGWQGGKVLDPGCGVASFRTFCPDEIQPMITKYIGVEIEPITCAIAKFLHPDGSFYPKSMSSVMLRTSVIDLVIGNVPFEDGTTASCNGYEGKVALHAQILAKSLDLLKPGGLAFLITSSGLMDSKNPGFREFVDRKAVFLGALRLPSQTHKGISGTECTSDLILLQKRFGDDDDRYHHTWRSVVDSELLTHTDQKPIPYNEYFQAFPSALLGTPVADRTTFGDDFALDWDSDQPLLSAIKDALWNWADTIAPLPFTPDQVSQTPQENTMYATNTQPDWQTGITIVANPDKNGIEIRFPAKPPTSITDRLGKDARFRFTDRNSDARWYAPQTPDRWAWTKRFADEMGIDLEIPAHPEISDRQLLANLGIRVSDAPMPPPAEQNPAVAPMPIAQPTQPVQEPSAPASELSVWEQMEQMINDVDAFLDPSSFEGFAEQFTRLDEAEARIRAEAEARTRAEEEARLRSEVTARIRAAIDLQLGEYAASGDIVRLSSKWVYQQLCLAVMMAGMALGIQGWRIKLEMMKAQQSAPNAASQVAPKK